MRLVIRNGDQIRLTRAERRFLEGLVQEPVNPQTVEEYNAWLDYGMCGLSESVPEERLLEAVLQSMRIESTTGNPVVLSSDPIIEHV